MHISAWGRFRWPVCVINLPVHVPQQPAAAHSCKSGCSFAGNERWQLLCLHLFIGSTGAAYQACVPYPDPAICLTRSISQTVWGKQPTSTSLQPYNTAWTNCCICRPAEARECVSGPTGLATALPNLALSPQIPAAQARRLVGTY